MKTWTKQAEQRLEEYLAARVRRDGLAGEDAAELRDDLRRHVHEEVSRLPGERVGLADVSQVLAALDRGAGIAPMPPASGPQGPWAKFALWAGGVVLPAGVLLLELLTGFCGGVFFDPIPSWWHALLVGLVPASNAWLLTRGAHASSLAQGLAAGAGAVIAGFYALLFLPLLPASLMALVFGLGVLSLTPLLAWLAAWRIGRRRAAQSGAPWRFRAGWRIAAAATVALLALLEGPALWTRSQLARATGDDRAAATAAVASLRAFHSRRTLLRACYEGDRGTSMATDIAGWLRMGWRIPFMMFGGRFDRTNDSEAVRNVFFRVTGAPFNTFPPPRMVRDGGAFGRGRNALFEDIEFDQHLGGDQVAVRLKHLDLTTSRLDAHVDTRSRAGYGEWTLVFHNGGDQAKEARCQVRLPRGGRVSRLTLWVNGEPREAAFHGVATVKAAYREVAVVQRRDPVLVTMAGPDTVLVQCFPVPPNGDMKVRFGVTAPLDGSRWELPRIVERNFGLAPAAEHALWLQADRPFDVSGSPSIPDSAKDGDGQSTHAALPLATALDATAAIHVGQLVSDPPAVWCEDRFADPAERFLERSPLHVDRPPAGRIVLVVDASATLAGEAWWLAEMLANDFPAGGIDVVLADDHALQIDPRQLASARFTGGCNNEPALRQAVRIAKESEHAAVVWLHGPQAVRLPNDGALQQMLERGTRRPTIHAIELVPGPNRLAEALALTAALRRGPTLFDKRADLRAFLQQLQQGGPAVEWQWRRAASAADMTGQPVWHQLALLWAIGEADSDHPQRAATAARYQLVTPVSGAVVLETAEQYARHGLTPADAAASPTIPGVPEPSATLLVLLTTTLALARRRRPASSSDAPPGFPQVREAPPRIIPSHVLATADAGHRLPHRGALRCRRRTGRPACGQPTGCAIARQPAVRDRPPRPRQA